VAERDESARASVKAGAKVRWMEEISAEKAGRGVMRFLGAGRWMGSLGAGRWMRSKSAVVMVLG
jgi:hypothetical protein